MRIEKVWQRTPTPHAARWEKIKKITRRIYILRRYAGLGPSHARTGILWLVHLANGCCFATFYASMCDNNFPSLLVSLFSWRCLVASISYFLHAAMNLHPPSVTVSTCTSASNAVAFQPPAVLNTRMSLGTQPGQSFPSPRCPLRSAPSGFLNAIPLGSRLPLIRVRSAPAPKRLVVRSVVSMLPHRVISRARVYEII